MEVAVETVVDPEALEKARAEAVAEMQAKLDKAREAKAKADEKRKQAEASVEILKKSLERHGAATRKRPPWGRTRTWPSSRCCLTRARSWLNKMRGLLLKARGREDPDRRPGDGAGHEGPGRGGWEVCGMSSWFDQARERLERECKEVKGTEGVRHEGRRPGHSAGVLPAG